MDTDKCDYTYEFLSLCFDRISNCLELDSKVNEIILSISGGQHFIYY